MKGILHDPEEPRGPTKMKVILAFEAEYRTYMEAIAAAIREFRPDIGVVAVTGGSEDLEAVVERIEPQLLICSHPVPENPADKRLALVELSPTVPSPPTSEWGSATGSRRTLPLARYYRWLTRPRGFSGHTASKEAKTLAMPPKMRRAAFIHPMSGKERSSTFGHR